MFGALAILAAVAAPWHGCVAASDHARVVRFRASDGTRLVAAEWGRGSRGVVLAHGRPASLCMWVAYARRLAASGYRVLAFDFRGSGFSEGPHYPASNRLDLDVEAAARVVRAHGAKGVVAVGTSWGGPATFVAGAHSFPLIGGVVGLSSIDSTTILNAVDAVSTSDVPVLLVAARGDGEIPRYSREIYAAARTSDKRLVVVGGREHSVGLFYGPARQEALTAIERFLRSHTG